MQPSHARDLAAVFLLALLTAALASSAVAQAPSRVGRGLSLGPDRAVVMVAPDRGWSPAGGDAPLSLCAGDRCAPVRTAESCAPPRCPGTGEVYVLERAIAEVSDFPTDRDGFTREVERLRGETSFSPIAWGLGAHPEPPPGPPEPVRFVSGRHVGLTWEAELAASGGGLGAAGVGATGGEASFGLRFSYEIHGEDEEFLAVMLGNVMGADLRVRSFALMPAQSETVWAVAIGVGPSMGIAANDWSVRVPSVYGSVLPEFGVMLRPDRPAAWYAGWTLPFTFLLDAHVGVDARATVLIVDDWVAGDDVEALVTLGLGLVLR